MRTVGNARAAVRRAWRNFPLLPAAATSILFGLSIYATFFQSDGGSVIALTKSTRELRSTGYTELAEAFAPIPEPKVTCGIRDARYRGTVLVAADSNPQQSADECRRSCKHLDGCNAWRWCADYQGCLDEVGGSMPLHSCKLNHEHMEPSGIPSDRLVRHVKPTTYTAGWLKHRALNQSTFLRTQSAPTTPLLIVTYVPPAECSLPEGNRINLMSILNKQDYAHWHSYTFHLATQTVDSTLRPPGSPEEGSWNKVGILRKILSETSSAEAEWVLWMEPDALFDDISFSFPFEFYQGLDVVMIGNPDMARSGDHKGLSTSVMLLRNSKWTRDFLDDLAAHAHQHSEASKDKHRLQGFDPVGSAMMAVMQRNIDKYLAHFTFEGEFCLACDWRRIDLALSSKVETTKVWGEENKRWKLFITRLFDCEMCWEGVEAAEPLPTCRRTFAEHYEFAYCRFSRMTQAIQREAKEGPFLSQLHQQNIPSKGFNYTAFMQQAGRERGVLKIPQDHHTLSHQECYEACVAEHQCGRWVWCSHREGCDNQGVFQGNFPNHGCELSRVIPTASPYEWTRGPQLSSFASGFIPADHPSRVSWAKRMSGGADSTTRRLLLTSGLPTAPCSTPYGDLVIRLAVQNKQDWARLHGHEYHLMAESVNAHMRPGAWQKMGYLRKLLLETPRERAEWIGWMDMDIVLTNMAFDIPFQKYDGKDFVIWGNRDNVLKGDVYQGLNSGTFLVRNTDSSRSMMEAFNMFGSFPANRSVDEILRANLPGFDIGMFEQNAITYVLMQTPDMMSRVHFESDYCINCWYKDAYKPHIPQPPFAVHFAGCQVCTGFHPERLGDCVRELVRAYIDSHAQLRELSASKAVNKAAIS